MRKQTEYAHKLSYAQIYKLIRVKGTQLTKFINSETIHDAGQESKTIKRIELYRLIAENPQA